MGIYCTGTAETNIKNDLILAGSAWEDFFTITNVSSGWQNKWGSVTGVGQCNIMYVTVFNHNNTVSRRLFPFGSHEQYGNFTHVHLKVKYITEYNYDKLSIYLKIGTDTTKYAEQVFSGTSDGYIDVYVPLYINANSGFATIYFDYIKDGSASATNETVEIALCGFMNGNIYASNTARRVKNIYVGVNGVARKVKKVYVGVNGVARLCYSGGTIFSGTVPRRTSTGTSSSSIGTVTSRSTPTYRIISSSPTIYNGYRTVISGVTFSSLGNNQYNVIGRFNTGTISVGYGTSGKYEVEIITT